MPALENYNSLQVINYKSHQQRLMNCLDSLCMIGFYKSLQIRLTIILGAFVSVKIDYMTFQLVKSSGGHPFFMHVLLY